MRDNECVARNNIEPRRVASRLQCLQGFEQSRRGSQPGGILATRQSGTGKKSNRIKFTAGQSIDALPVVPNFEMRCAVYFTLQAFMQHSTYGTTLIREEKPTMP